MAKTESRQFRDGTVGRDDLNVATVGQAVIRKVIQGAGISLSSSGADAGTGDVIISASAALQAIAGAITVSGGNVDINSVVRVSSDATGEGYQPLASNLYIQSRELNLITNGSGLLGNNYNFPQFTFDPADLFSGGGSFRITSNAAYGFGQSSELIPINPSNTYILSAMGKSGDVGGGNYTADNYQYLGLECFDIDGLSIFPLYFMKYPGSTDTTLAVTLVPGATTITLTNATGWHNGTDPGYARHMLWYPYTNSKGYTYPNYTYSRNTSYFLGNYATDGTWITGGISGNVLTLSAPWPGPTLSAGTSVRNGYAGGSYKYLWTGALPNTWTKRTGTPIGGIDTEGTNGYQFPYGTAFAKLLFLTNYQGTGGNNVRWNNLSFTQSLEYVAGNLNVGGNITASNLSGTNTGDQTLPTRVSLGLATTDDPTFAGINSSGNYTVSNGRKGLVGVYNAAQTQAIFAMGPSYALTDGGASNVYGDFYGIAWSYDPGYGGAGNNPQSKAGLQHQALFMLAGVTQTAIGTGIWTIGGITALGNVRIGGTTAPISKLHVTLADNTFAHFGNVVTTAAHYSGISLGYYEVGPSYVKSAIVQEQIGDNAARGTIHILNNGEANSANATLADARISITYAGNVGIGMSTPGAKLQVQGASTYSAEIGHLRLSDSATPGKFLYAGYDGAIDAGYIQAINTGIEVKPLILQGIGGNVGIGTTNLAGYPSGYLGTKLVVYDTSGNGGMTLVTTTTGAHGLYFADGVGNDSYRGGIVYDHTADTLTIYAGGNGHFALDSTGNLSLAGTVGASNLSGTNTGDQTLPTRASLGLATTDSPTFAGLTANGVITANVASGAYGFLCNVSGVNPTLAAGFFQPSLSNGNRVSFGLGLDWATSGKAGYVSFVPSATLGSNRIGFGFYGFDDVVSFFYSGGVSIGNTTNPGAGNLTATGYMGALYFVPTLGSYGVSWPSGPSIIANSANILKIIGDGVLDRIQLGGETSSFSAIKCNGAGIEIRLADDSAYADLSAKTQAPGDNSGKVATTAFVQASTDVKGQAVFDGGDPITNARISGSVTSIGRDGAGKYIIAFSELANYTVAFACDPEFSPLFKILENNATGFTFEIRDLGGTATDAGGIMVTIFSRSDWQDFNP